MNCYIFLLFLFQFVLNLFYELNVALIHDRVLKVALHFYKLSKFLEYTLNIFLSLNHLLQKCCRKVIVLTAAFDMEAYDLPLLMLQNMSVQISLLKFLNN